MKKLLFEYKDQLKNRSFLEALKSRGDINECDFSEI